MLDYRVIHTLYRRFCDYDEVYACGNSVRMISKNGCICSLYYHKEKPSGTYAWSVKMMFDYCTNRKSLNF